MEITASEKLWCKNLTITYESEKEVTFEHCPVESMPMEEFCYVVLDTKKWNEIWRKDVFRYLPEDITELLENEFLNLPVHALQKAHSKIRRVLQYLEEDNEIWSPVIETDIESVLSLADGRHRYWVIRNLNIPFFTAAIAVKHLPRLIECDVIYKNTELSQTFDPFTRPEWDDRKY